MLRADSLASVYLGLFCSAFFVANALKVLGFCITPGVASIAIGLFVAGCYGWQYLNGHVADPGPADSVPGGRLYVNPN